MACRALLAACLVALMATSAFAQKKEKATPEKGRLTAEHQVRCMLELLREVERHALPAPMVVPG